MQARSFDTDVFVIGGGPAGLTAAIAARQQGLRAIVADVARPPLDKACGEGLMPDSFAELKGFGVSFQGYRQGAFRGIRFVGPGTTVEADFPSGTGIGMRRTTLHLALAEQAAKCGVDLLWGRRVDFLSGNSVRLGGCKINSRFVVGADGQNSLVRRWAQLDSGREVERRFALRQHFRLATVLERVEIHWGDESQAYVTPIDEDEVCIAIVSRRRLRDFAAESRRIASLSEALRGSSLTSSVRGGLSISRRLKRVHRGNIALVGDASGSVDAITGEGMALSFRQALALAEAMTKEDLRSYEAAHRRIGALPQFMGRAMLLLDKSPILRRKALAVFQHNPDLFRRLLSIHVGDLPIKDFGTSAGSLRVATGYRMSSSRLSHITLGVVLTAFLSFASLGFAQELSFKADPARSIVDFVLGDVLHTVHGTFRLKESAIQIDSKTGKAMGGIVVDATSGNTGNDARDHKMHKEILESAKYPEIRFTVENIQGKLSLTGSSEVKLSGTMSIHGGSHPLTVTVPVQIADGKASADVHFLVPYVQWGIKDPSTFVLRSTKKWRLRYTLSVLSHRAPLTREVVAGSQG